MPGLRWAGPTGKLRRSPGGSDELPPRLPCRQPRRCAQTPVLSRIFALLSRKEAPFAYLDSHAGVGLYDGRRPCQPHRRVAAGHRPHLAGRNPPGAADDYLGVIRSLNGRRAALLPGSPELARQLTREQDRLQLNEKHPRMAPCSRTTCPATAAWRCTGARLACTAGADADPRSAWCC